MSESIWTRQRKLKEREEKVLENLRERQKNLANQLEHDNWGDAALSANTIMILCIRMEEIERELEDVDALVEGWQRISNGMELLEGKS